MKLETEQIYRERGDFTDRLRNAVEDDLRALVAEIEALKVQVRELKDEVGRMRKKVAL